MDAHITYKFCKNRARDMPLKGNYIGKIPIFFSFVGRKPPPLDRSRWNLAQRSGPTVRSSLPNFTLINTTCRPCGAKNPKIGQWVNEIPSELPAADPAGNNNNIRISILRLVVTSEAVKYFQISYIWYICTGQGRLALFSICSVCTKFVLFVSLLIIA